MDISIILPSRNNLKYLKWSYESIRKNQGNHNVQICIADDASTDGTSAWLDQLRLDDPHVSVIRNDGPNRLGHTILYDRLINEVAVHPVCMIYHADMYLAPGALDEVERYLYENGQPKLKTIVSLTRVEPPLHPSGVEKVLKDFGQEPEQFIGSEFDAWAEWYGRQVKDKTTRGVFAPWAFFKQTFKDIGGHDRLYAPQSKEDSVVGDTLVLVEIDGFKQISKVQDLWAKYANHEIVRADGKHLIDMRELGVNVSIMTPKHDGEIGLEPINAMIKHSTPKNRLVDVHTAWGMVTVTEDHSLIDEDCIAKKFYELDADTCWKPSELSEWTRRNLLSSLQIEYSDNSEELNTNRNDFILPTIGEIDYYGNNTVLRDLCEFLGFFVAEGSVSSTNSISICGNDPEELEYYALLFCRLFSADITTRQTSEKELGSPVYSYRWGSKKLSGLLREMVGDGAANKKVPDFLFNIPKAYQESFLYGYLRGDGYLGTTLTFRGYDSKSSVSVDKRLFFKRNSLSEYTWKSTSKSEVLTLGINYLLMRCFPGVRCRISFDDNKEVYNLSTCKFRKAPRYDVSREKYTNDLTPVDVFDFEVRNTNTFIGGVGMVGLHNSDIFNRFLLNDVEFIQTWRGLVYHLTCRGSRFNPTLTAIGTNSNEWELQNQRSARNFIRKWGSYVKHDEYMQPIVPPKYEMAIVITNCTFDLLASLEPWYSEIHVDLKREAIDEYIRREQGNTLYDLRRRVFHIGDQMITAPIQVHIDGKTITETDAEYIFMLPQIIEQSGEITTPGQMIGIGTIRMTINEIRDISKDLIMMEADHDKFIKA